MSNSLPRLSRYEVLGRLASGGMAEVFLARALGVAGFEKLVVVKTILPQFAKDPHFVTMFVNEARLAARLNHPNCVHIFDLGQENGLLYIAMEYIDGFALSRVLSRAKTKNKPLGEKLVARIAMDAASGLDYAHRLTDRDGTPLKLVHRDISPDNLLISLSGQTRVVDFGIAKAATPALMSAATAVGQVKGKHGFISPEYLLGLPIDGRADLFALGVVMYRALTRKRPFGGADDAAVSMAVIEHTPVPPHRIDPNINAALSDVVMTALEKDPARRYQTARDLRHAIEAAVGRPADVEEVGDSMAQLWPPGDEERTALNSLAAGTPEERSGPVLQSVSSGTWPGQSGTPAKVVVHQTPPTAEEAMGQLLGNARPAAPAPVQVAVFETPQFDSGGGGGSTALAVFAVAALVVAAGLGWYAWQQKPTQAPVAPPAPVVVVAVDAGEVEVDAGVAVAVAAPVAPPAPVEGTLELKPPVSVHVFDEKEDLGATPLTLKRPAGEVTLRLVNKALGVDQALKVAVQAGESTTVDALAKGALIIKADPWAYVTVDGKSYGQTPVTLRAVYEGPHVVVLKNVGLNETRRRTVQVKGGETKVVSVDLSEDE